MVIVASEAVCLSSTPQGNQPANVRSFAERKTTLLPRDELVEIEQHVHCGHPRRCVGRCRAVGEGSVSGALSLLSMRLIAVAVIRKQIDKSAPLLSRRLAGQR